VRSFRPPTYCYETVPGKRETWSLPELRRALGLFLSPRHFFLGPGIELEFEQKLEHIPWELFKGRLLEAVHTRVRQEFEAWNVFWVDGEGRSDEPILALKLDVAAQQVHVIRAIHSYVWEGYDAGGNVIESRETTRWVRELVGSIHLNEFNTGGDLLDEINCLLFLAVVGTSRLPLTSVENPLPAFTLGQLSYVQGIQPGEDNRPLRSVEDLIRAASINHLAQRERVKLLETVLRACSWQELPTAAQLFVAKLRKIGYAAKEYSTLMQDLFTEVSLSPYTDFVDKTLNFIDFLEQQCAWTNADRIDFLSWLLINVARHLTAYDLRTFHHRGANYPDALLLDAVLKAYFLAIDADPELYIASSGDTIPLERQKRRRRRALRQGWLLRVWYEGLPVPEIPTSPGENRRVLPSSHPRVPDDQILQPERRAKRLFDGDKLDRHFGETAPDLLAQSMADLEHPEELKELGLAVFLDRPLGVHKNPGEPDQTPLLSYLAFSRFVAESRLRFLADNGLLKKDDLETLCRDWELLSLQGVSPLPPEQNIRPGVVSIADAARSAPDFVILKTTKKSVADFMEFFQFNEFDPQVSPINWAGGLPLLIVQENCPQEASSPTLSFYDAAHIKRLQLIVDASAGYSFRAGVELPRPGLRILRAWTAEGKEITMQGNLVLAR
jgi:hypothetical protein